MTNMKIMRLGLFICSFFLASCSLIAQGEYEKQVFVSSQGDSLLYRLLRPEVEKKDQKYPLVLFLHGAGERGNDNEKQLTHGGQMFLNPVNRRKYPSYVIFPQCPVNGYWAYKERPTSFVPGQMAESLEITPIFKSLKEMLDTYVALPQVDKDRIYIIGLSMGAMGTYDITVRYPDLFAAAIPICGSVNPDRLHHAKDVNFRIFHGDSDDIVPVMGSREAYRALTEAGANVEYIEFPGCNHGSWNPAFNRTDFMSWLYSQRKKKSK